MSKWIVKVAGGYSVTVDAETEPDARKKGLEVLIRMGHSVTPKDQNRTTAVELRK